MEDEEKEWSVMMVGGSGDTTATSIPAEAQETWKGARQALTQLKTTGDQVTQLMEEKTVERMVLAVRARDRSGAKVDLQTAMTGVHDKWEALQKKLREWEEAYNRVLGGDGDPSPDEPAREGKHKGVKLGTLWDIDPAYCRRICGGHYKDPKILRIQDFLEKNRPSESSSKEVNEVQAAAVQLPPEP